MKVAPSHPGTAAAGNVHRRLRKQQDTDAQTRAGAIQNIDTTEMFATIQAAIDDPDTMNGHTLEVQANHSEGLVTIDKSITLRGMTGSETVTATTDTGSSGDARAWFLVETGVVVMVQDLTFDGDSGSGRKIYQAFRIKGSGSFDDCAFQNIHFTQYIGFALAPFGDGPVDVTDCTFSNIERVGVLYFGSSVNGSVYDGNTYTGKGPGDQLDYAVELGGGAVATLQNSAVSACQGVASSDGSTSAGVLITTFFGAGTAGALSGNFLNANTRGVFVGFDSGDTSAVTVTDNDLSSNDSEGLRNVSGTETVDASGNWWGSNDPTQVVNQSSGLVDYTPWLDVGTDTSADPGFQGDFSVLNVDDDSPQTGAASRIQEGIDLVTASTVNVAPGTYAPFVVNTTVTLLGAQAGIDARGRVVGPPDPMVESIVTAGGGILVELLSGSAGSVIDGFSLVGGANAIRSNGGPLDDLVIQNNHVEGTTGAAVFLNDSGADITMHQNAFDGSSMTSGGGLVHLDTDAFPGFHFTSNWAVNQSNGFGLFVDGNRNVGSSASRDPLFEDNLFDANNQSMNIGKRALENALITGNTFSNNNLDGLLGGPKDSTITRNAFTDNGRFGLALTSFGDADPLKGAQNTGVTENFFSNNASGDAFFSSGQAPGTISTNTLFNNSLASPIGATYAGAEIIDASGNWWGSNDENMVLAATSGMIDFTPFLDTGSDTSADPGFQGDFSTLHVTALGEQAGATGRVQEGVDLVSGSTVNIGPGTFLDNIVIDQTLTLDAAGSGTDPNDTIIQSAAASTPVIRLQAGGNSASDRLTVRDVRLTGATGSGNPASGIEFDAGTGSWLTFENVASVGNQGDGIATDCLCAVEDVEVIDCNLSNNGEDGLNVNSTDAIDELSITGTTVNNNGRLGAFLEGALDHLTVQNCTFNGHTDAGLWADRLTGTVTVDNVEASDNARGIFFRIRGGTVNISNATTNANNYAAAFLRGWGLSVYATGTTGGGPADSAVNLTDVTSSGNDKVNVLVTNSSNGNLTEAALARVTSTGSRNADPNGLSPFGEGAGIWLRSRGTGTAGTIDIRDSLVDDNNRGILIDAAADTFDALTIENNVITNNGTGLDVESGTSAANVTANFNQIYANGFGFDNTDTTVVDALHNYWGDASGPADPAGTNEVDNPPCFPAATAINSDGLGNGVSNENVNYCPWRLGAGVLELATTDCQDDALPGELGFQIEATLSMRDLIQDVTGFQAFLAFDDAVLSYRGDLSAYTASPFPLHIQAIGTAEVAPGELRLDGSVDLMDPPTDADALLATLIFDVDTECSSTSVDFDTTQPFDSELSFEGSPLPTGLIDTGSFLLDDTPPVLTCNTNITQNADAGGCDALVTWTASTANDNCDGDISGSVTYEIDLDDDSTVDATQAGTSFTFPTGTHRVTAEATDGCGNTGSCSFTVTIEAENTITATVVLDGVDAADAPVPPLQRCIAFTAKDGSNCATTVSVQVDFFGDPATGTATFEVECGGWTELCAKDEQHTLFDTVALNTVGTDFETATDLVLLGGDTDNDSDVDINDVTFLLFTFGTFAVDGDCPFDGARDADFSNNGVVGSEDYTFLTANWLALTDCVCTVLLNQADVSGVAVDWTRDAPSRDKVITSLQAADLPLEIAEAADLNADGWVDYRDVRIFEHQQGLPYTLSDAIRRMADAD